MARAPGACRMKTFCNVIVALCYLRSDRHSVSILLAEIFRSVQFRLAKIGSG